MSEVSPKQKTRETIERGLYFNHKTGLYEHGQTIDGRWTLKSLHGARNVTEARRMIEGRKRKIEKREIVAPSDRQYADVAADFIAAEEKRLTWKEGGLSKASFKNLQDDYRRDLSYFERYGRIDKVTSEHIEKWLRDELRPRVGFSSQKRIVGTLRRLLASHFRLVGGVSPMEGVDPGLLPKQSKEARRRKRKLIVPKVPDIYSFLASVVEEYRLIVTLVVFTGCRISEAIALRWQDVDFEANTITFRNQLYRGEWKEATKTPAGDDRVAPLFPFLREELLLRRSAELDAGRGEEEDWVLLDADDEVFQDHSVLRRVKLAADASGLSKLTTHKLRHWFITTLQWAGVPRPVVKDIVGHEDDDRNDVTTLYTHAYDQEETLAMVQERCAAIGFGAIGGVPSSV